MKDSLRGKKKKGVRGNSGKMNDNEGTGKLQKL